MDANSTSNNELPQQLFHYTSAAGALGIISSAKVWATMIHYLNDAQELQYAIRLARMLIFQSDVAAPRDTQRERICSEFLDALKLVAVYTFSVTEQRDQLSQWRGYSSTEGGYAIGFDTAHLQTIAKFYGGALVQCIYDKDAQLTLLKPVVDEMLDVTQGLPEDARGLDLYRAYAERFIVVAAAIKDQAFHEEREWRIISGLGVNRDLIKYRTSGSFIVPYCEWSIRQGDTYPISTIIVGPNINRDLAARSLRHLTGTKLGWPVRVDYSAAPYRPLR